MLPELAKTVDHARERGRPGMPRLAVRGASAPPDVEGALPGIGVAFVNYEIGRAHV